MLILPHPTTSYKRPFFTTIPSTLEIMGSNVKPDPISIPRLPLFSMTLPQPHHHESSGMLTPPLQTSASVPFRWEEEPGKPRLCTDLIVASTHHATPPNRCLELPPRLATMESNVITKTPSPTTVLNGPGDFGSKSVFSSSSFRFSRERRRREQRQGSFDSCSGGWSSYDDNGGGLQQLLLGNKQQQKCSKGLFGSFRLSSGMHKPKSTTTTAAASKDDGDGKGSFVISPTSKSTLSSTDSGFFEGKRMRRNSSLSNFTRAHFWATIYEGFMQVVPWKKKPKKES